MVRAVAFSECPKCALLGKDSSGDNLATYQDGSTYCFSCLYYRSSARLATTYFNTKGVEDDKEKAVLPFDFTREVPVRGWKWLLQYGLGYSYWSPYIGYSKAYDRLIIKFGDPASFSIGRDLSGVSGRPKWQLYGDGHSYCEILGAGKEYSGDGADEGIPKEAGSPVVVVEDIISAHKVAQVVPSLCLFGTNVHNVAIKCLNAFKQPILLWLDSDQYHLLPSKINRLQSLIGTSVGYIRTDKDPKCFSISQIKEILHASIRANFRAEI